MAVFFELTTDVFKERFDRKYARGEVAPRAGAPSARRPLRGLEVKEDTFAMIKVVDMLGREIKLYDGGTLEGKGSSYTNFILQSVIEARQEKFQVVETFGDPYIFFYGEAPRFLECMSVLINSQDFNWQAEFWENYNEFLRGSKCAEMGARVYMFYDDKVVEGYMMMASAITDASNPMAVQLSFKLFLTNYRNISMVGDPRFPVRLGVDVTILPYLSTSGSEIIDPTAGNEVINPQTGETVTRLRSLIIDNKDEWTGPQPPVQLLNEEDETEDLIRKAVEAAAANYSNMNNVDSIADAGLNNANSGYGTGGAAPSKKPNTTGPTTSESSTLCAPGTETTNTDGSVYCTTLDDRKIRIGYANSSIDNPAQCPPNTSTPGCPEVPPPAPPGDTAPAQPPAAPPPPPPPPPPPSPSEGAGGTSGGFTSTTLPDCPCAQSPCNC